VAIMKVPGALITHKPLPGSATTSPVQPSTSGVASALGKAMAGARQDDSTTAPATPPQLQVLGRWITNEAEGLAAGRTLNLPVMLDFRADWCAACIELEKKTFPEEQVKQALSNGFITVKIDATEPTEETDALMKKYKAVSLPTVAFVDTQGKIRHEHTLYTFEAADLFLKRLETVSRLK